MNRDTLKKYLTTEATMAGIDNALIVDRVESAINMGLEAFWGSWNWYFKRRKADFTASTAAETYDAPSDFGGLIKITSDVPVGGHDIVFYEQEEFNRRFPNTSIGSPGYAVAVTCFQTEQQWKLQFYPRPSAGTIFDLIYEIELAGAVEAIPEGFVDGLTVCCAKYIGRLGGADGLALERRWQIIKQSLLLQNNVHKKPLNSLGGQTAASERLPLWADPNAPIL